MRVALAALSLTAGMVSAQKLAVTSLRHHSLPELTRITVELSGEFRQRHDRLSNPPRVYFDIESARIGPGVARRTDLNDGRVSRIRIAQTTPTVTRIVIDLAGDVDLRTSAHPRRLLIELRRHGPPADAAPVVSRPPLPPRAGDPLPDHVARFQPETRATPPEPALVASPMPVAAADATATPPPVVPRDPGLVPNPAQRNRGGGRSLTRVLGLKLGKVVIDPGHGGHDVGTTSGGRILEKNLVLDVSKRLAVLIEERLGGEVILTRTEDVFMPLERRTEIANEQKADLFLSIHANSSPYRAVTGAETYYLNFTTSREDLEVAARENAGSERSIHDLSELVRKIALKDKLEESREFAARIQSSLHELHARTNSKSRNRGVKKAPFVVLIGASMPSVLTEIGFVSNAREENLLKTGDYRQKLADAIYNGIEKYAETLSHFKEARVAAMR